MTNKVIYFFAVLFTAVMCFSCSDSENNDSDDLTGNWNYKASHVVFDYPGGKIALPNGMTLGQLIPSMAENPLMANLTEIPTEMLVPFVSKIANDKMKDYFRGLKFISDTQVEILMTMNDKDASMKAAYTVQKDIIGLTLDKEDLKAIAGKDLNIPTISLNYTIDKNGLTIYLDKVAIQGMMSQFLPMLLEQMMPGAPEAQVEGMKQYISGVLGNATKIEIGFVLTR